MRTPWLRLALAAQLPPVGRTAPAYDRLAQLPTMLPLASTISALIRRDSSAWVLHLTRCMCRKLASLALLLATCLSYTRMATACICPEIQPRMLIPTPDSLHFAGDPILVGASQAATPFLYDPSGNLVELRLLKQGGTLMPCAGEYFLYQPSTTSYGTIGEFTMLLANDLSPSVVGSFSTAPDSGYRDVALSAEIDLSRTHVEPFEPSSGMCAPVILDGVTIDGIIEYVVTLSRAAPVFVEAWYDDPSLGRIQDFASTVPIVAAETSADVSAEVRIELPHVQGSSDCVDVRLYTWTFQRAWSDRICFTAFESMSFNVQFEMSELNLRDTVAVAPSYTRTTTSSCAVGRQPYKGGTSPYYLLVLALLRRRQWWPRKNQTSGSKS